MYRYGFLACSDIRYRCHQKKPITDSRSDICIIVKSVHLPTLQHVHVFIAILCLWWYTAWVSIVQSRQLGTHKHFYVYSHEALYRYFCIQLMVCEKAGTASFHGYPVTLLFITRYSITASFIKTVISFPATDSRPLVFIWLLVA